LIRFVSIQKKKEQDNSIEYNSWQKKANSKKH